MTTIYLSIAGFYIKLSFGLPPTKSSELFLLNNLPKQIKETFSGFIYGKKPPAIDFEIKFYKRIPTIISEKKEKDLHVNYLYLFTEEKNTARTFLHISISQFIFITLPMW